MFRRFGGTSGAGPHVAGAFALLQQAHPDWGPEKLEERIFETADASGLTPDAGSTPNRAWGHGKVDLFEAVTGRDELGYRHGASVGFDFSSGGDAGPNMRDAGAAADGGSVILLSEADSKAGCVGCRSGGGKPPASLLLFGLLVCGGLATRYS